MVMSCSIGTRRDSTERHVESSEINGDIMQTVPADMVTAVI